MTKKLTPPTISTRDEPTVIIPAELKTDVDASYGERASDAEAFKVEPYTPGPKTCATCRHHDVDAGQNVCLSPLNLQNVDLVTGNHVVVFRNCKAHRTAELVDDVMLCGCGRVGRWWEAK
jgi:hypothetical protein